MTNRTVLTIQTSALSSERRGRPVGARHLAILAIAGFALGSCGSDTPSSATPASTVAAATGSDAGGNAATGSSSERNPGGVYGPYGVYERVQFPAGTTGTTFSDAVVRGTVNGYLFGARSGQRMTVELVSENAVFTLFAPDDTELTGGRYALVDPLDMDGDYLVVVESEFGNASFELIAEITDSTGGDDDGAAEATSCPVGYVEFDGNYPLRICHKGEIVSVLQSHLVDLGYDIDVDGYFGEQTQTALADAFDDGVGELRVASDMEALRDCDADC